MNDAMIGFAERSYTHWRTQAAGSTYPRADVLFFIDEPPQELKDTGFYVGYQDFIDIRRRARATDEFLTQLYHTLVLHFLEGDKRVYDTVLGQLRYNPNNHSNWNTAAWTHHYYLATQTVVDYAHAGRDPAFKIPGIGSKGRYIMRAVVDMDEGIDQLLERERNRF